MKNVIPILWLLLIAISWSSCKTGGAKSSRGEASIEFDTTGHDFGEIAFAGEANYDFVFNNPGKSPLLLTHVKSTCGCTIPEWQHEPIGSGEKGSIRVSYDTHRVGAFTKSIYVYSNASNGVQRLIITGRVKPADMNL